MPESATSELERAQANLVVHSASPLNAEPPMDRLVSTFITPQKDLYIRSHGEVQHLDGATHRLKVAGQVEHELEFTVQDLRDRFPRPTLTASLQCAGNRRADLQEVKKTEGDPWQAAALGNASWTGVSLRDVLGAAGAATHASFQVAFYSSDEIEVEGETARFGVSIPMPKALSGEVLLAFEMNGEPLLPEHGLSPARHRPRLCRGAKRQVGVRGAGSGPTSREPDPDQGLKAVAASCAEGGSGLEHRPDHRRSAAQLGHLRAGARRQAEGRSRNAERLGDRL